MSPTEEFAALIRSELASTPADPNPEFERAMMAKLLHYARFRDQPGHHPDPFDDPFVGAALFTSDYRLLGAYRKRKSGERHSEPEAIIEALRHRDEATGRAIVEDIERAYKGTIWLQSTQRSLFEDHFRRAGDHLRSMSGAAGLIMFSSLEPCGLYEANPSCADILCACHVGRVLYASDDTNPKGRGRPILIRGKVDVTPNLLPQEAVALNSRFFATVEICNSTYTDYSHRRLFAGAPCAAFGEDEELFRVQMGPDDRLAVKAVRPFEVQYAGPEHGIVSPFVTSGELKTFEQFPIEPQANFFYGGDSLGELSKLLIPLRAYGGAAARAHRDAGQSF